MFVAIIITAKMHKIKTASDQTSEKKARVMLIKHKLKKFDYLAAIRKENPYFNSRTNCATIFNVLAFKSTNIEVIELLEKVVKDWEQSQAANISTTKVA